MEAIEYNVCLYKGENQGSVYYFINFIMYVLFICCDIIVLYYLT